MSSLPCHAAAGSFFSAPLQDFETKRASVLKHLARSERLAEVRPAARLEVRPRPEMLSTGIPQIDALTGGIPRGCMSEIYGPASSGKTSILLATLAAATRRDESCVLIDASDSFDPASGQTAGVEFRKFLWIRCGNLSLCSSVPSVVKDFKNSNHRGHRVTQRKNPNEFRLEQVLKTTDLILQSGGFGLVALNLAGIPEKFVRRIPLASWFRFQRAVEHTKTALLVVTEFRCAESCATVILKCESQPSAFSHQLSEKASHTELLKKLHIDTELVRSRLERKPMQSVKADFTTRTVQT
jgi:recombination protein RecA